MKTKIKQLLQEKGMSQTELADITGIQMSEISKLLNNKRRSISLEKAVKISKALGLDVNQLICD